MKEEEPSVDDEWRQIEQRYVETCEKMLGTGETKHEGLDQYQEGESEYI